jgi:hypothetical protein
MTKTPKLLVEYFPISYSMHELNESIKGNAPFRIKAILQRANEKNQNGRVYPMPVLMRESQKYMTEFVKQRRALGELDHPESRTVVNLSNVSHNIVEMHWQGNDLMGTVEVLSTPSGNIVKELMKGGIRLGMSSRGVGSVNPIGVGEAAGVEVDEDFNLICFDIVSNPSTDGAFLGEGVNRSLEVNRSLRINGLIGDFFSELGR